MDAPRAGAGGAIGGGAAVHQGLQGEAGGHRRQALRQQGPEAAGQLLFGTDFPHFTAKYTAKRLEQYDGFDERTLAAIYRGNALKLFPRFK